MLDFRILGPVEVVERQRTIALGSPKQRALLAILVLRRGEVVTSERLIDQLWGERPPASAAKTLQGYVSHLRRALGSGVLLTQGSGYVLAADAGQVDAERFARLAADGRVELASGNAARARELLSSALELWRGEALADVAYEPFAGVEIARLEEARHAALEDRIEADLMRGQHRGLVGELESLVALHPHREPLRGQLMLALYRSGRQTEALEVYRRGRQALDDELGLEPGRELRALEQRILDHDPTLDQPPAPATPAPARPVASRRWGVVAIAGGLLLTAAIAAGVVALTSGSVVAVRVAPNSVAAIDIHTNQVVAAVPVGARPSAIAFGSGSLWIANLDDQTVSRVDPRTLLAQPAIKLAEPPTGIAAVDGSIWVVGSSPSAPFVSVSRIDPIFDTIAETVRVGNVVPGSPSAVAAYGGSLWVAPYAGVLSRLNPASGRVVEQVDPNAAPAGISVGAGAVWVTDSIADTVTRVDPTGLLKALPVGGNGPSGIAVGDDGVWVADRGDDAVVRIDPDTGAVTATIPVGEAPAGIAVGAGSVWVADSGDGTVTRIDATTAKAAATIAVGGSPQAITVSDGRVWVTVDAPTIPAKGLTSAGTLKVDSQDDVDSMDPALAYEPLSWQLLYATCAKLLNYPDRSGTAGSQLVPEVAQSLPTISDGGRTYTFTIRKGFRFSPPLNAPVTAQTFKYTIERTLNPQTRNPVASEFDDIVGARAYMAGRVTHISGVIASGNTLTIRLTAPAPDLPSRVAQPFFCAVPSDTPINPAGIRVIPSAGPYYVESYTPDQGVVLARNPNYHGNRPHRFARIDLTVGIPPKRAIAQVEAGAAGYAVDGEIDTADAATLAARYGPGSPAAEHGRQQYFVSTEEELDFFALNTHRPLFASVRLRRAVNYAIDRTTLARLGDGISPLPVHPTDHYIPPGVPGYANVHVYPLTPDVAKARQLARGHADATVVMYTCEQVVCLEQAHVVKTDLAAIGLHVEIKAFQEAILSTKLATPGEPFDIAEYEWKADYPDPDDFLNLQLESATVLPTFADPASRRQLAAAARLTGAERYLTYARLDADLARNAAPLVAFGNASTHELFSARAGCQIAGVYGTDLAALCIRGSAATNRATTSAR